MLRQFQSRNDNQITGLEIFAIALGLSTFQAEVAGRVLVLYSDNKGVPCFVLVYWLVAVSVFFARSRAQYRQGISKGLGS
jgi:hypothetical protein